MRFVADSGTLVADARAVRAGRGAWVHPTAFCVETATARRAFARALRCRIDSDEAARAYCAHIRIDETEEVERIMDQS